MGIHVSKSRELETMLVWLFLQIPFVYLWALLLIEMLSLLVPSLLVGHPSTL